ncbi:hypothetical protein [Shewanella algae]|uniref:hypothetical protein n=1 Tax=Shewanella algae TaxID=38313 RepID=UPI002117A770|nr:hypothetical protein [Shewanella algae]
MELPLQVVQDLAPDQSSLGAAKKLLNTSKWPMLGVASELNSIWGSARDRVPIPTSPWQMWSTMATSVPAHLENSRVNMCLH